MCSWRRAYRARNIRDEDEIVSLGLFDMTEDDYRLARRRRRRRTSYPRSRRRARNLL